MWGCSLVKKSLHFSLLQKNSVIIQCRMEIFFLLIPFLQHHWPFVLLYTKNKNSNYFGAFNNLFPRHRDCVCWPCIWNKFSSFDFSVSKEDTTIRNGQTQTWTKVCEPSFSNCASLNSCSLSFGCLGLQMCLCHFQITSGTALNIPALPGSNRSASPKCLHHFLVIQVHWEQHLTPPRNGVSVLGATCLHHSWVVSAVPGTVPNATWKCSEPVWALFFGLGSHLGLSLGLYDL